MPTTTDRTMEMPIPREVAVRFVQEEMGTRPADRPMRAIRFGEDQLGQMWQLMEVRTVRADAGYDVLMGRFREVWP